MSSQRMWLFVDGPYLCYRAFYSTGGLTYEAEPTGVVFGFLKEIQTLEERYPDACYRAFFFDGDSNKRKLMWKDYKANRNEQDPTKRAIKKAVRRQTHKLRDELLREIGFRNIFCQDGYEADDLIAVACEMLRPQDKAIIVSGDKDLLQLLGPRVSVWTPKDQRLITVESFRKEYGIEPSQWVDVKAIAGCSSDNIDGVEGVGEATAIKHLRGNLKPGSKKHNAIVTANAKWKRNLSLIQLPLPGVEAFTFKKDRVTVQAWNRVARSIGARTLVIL